MVDGKVSDDDVEKMLSEIYRQANMEMDESAIRMMQEISREASKERRSQEIQRPSDVLSERNLRTMKTIEENQSLKRSEPPPSVEFSGSGSDDIEEPSSSFSRHSRSHSGSRSPSRSDSRSYSGSRSPSRSGSRSYSGSKSYSQSRSGSDSRSYSKSQSGSRRDSAYSDSRSHSRSAKSSSRSGDSRSSRASRGSQSRSRRSSSNSRDSRSYSRSRSPGDSRSSYSSRGSRSSGSSRSYYSQELSPKQQPEPLLPDQESKPEEGGNSWFSRYLFPRTLRSQSPSLNDKEDDDESEASAGGRCCTPAALAFVLCILIAVGLGIGFGIDAANKAGGGDKDSQAVVGEIKLLDAKEYFLFGGEEMAVSTDVLDVGACIEFCREYDAMQYLNVQDSCTCYNSVSCLMPWGPKVDSNYLFEGSLYVKDKLEECSQDYCQAVDDNDGLCFTANRKDAKQYTVFGVALIEDDSTFASSERACLEKCANYDAASFVLPNLCTCFDNPTCWAEWGGNVDTSRFSGNVFSKNPLDICESDYCELNTEDSLCFTGNEEDCREYALYGDSLFKTAAERTGDLQACLDLCAPFDAAAFSNFTDCECYNFAQCKARWGDEVDSSNFIGSIYTKLPLQECEQDFCKTVAPIGLCFTGNVQSYSSYSLFGSNLEEVATSNDVNNKEECLDFCRKQDAAQFLNFQDPKCKCLSGADCWLAWPADQTETTGVEYTGDVYSKKKLQFCTVDFCSQFADSQLCAT